MGILDNIKDVVGTIQKIDNIELYRKILDLQAETITVVGENADLRAQLDTLREQLSIKQRLRFEHNAYWDGDSLESSEGPFCSKCWDSDRKLVRMHTCDNPQWSQCPICKKSLQIPRAENGFDKTEESPSAIAIEPQQSTRWY
jgi:hypothetical protein